jgi:5-methylthioribose kinase
MSRFDTYFLMDTESVVAYAKEKLDVFGADDAPVANEIGDGNLNYVFRVADGQAGKSVIVKQAGPELRIAKDFDISTDRNRIEVGMLQLEKKLCPGLVADIYLYDPVMKCFSMEDLSDYEVMRYALMKHKIFPQFAEDITDFMAATLLLTTDRVMDSKEKKELAREYVNPQLCADISEPLVYTEPYDDNLKRNKVFPPNLEFITKELYEDTDLHLEVAKLKYDFMNNAQALIHGDLHTGSIFIKQGATKVMDPEFAFYGPMGYDIGNVVANMIFAWANGDATIADAGEKETYLAWVEGVIAQVIDLFKQKYHVMFGERVTEPMAKTPGYREYFLDTILADTAGVTGLELNRRIAGMANVKDITTIPDAEKRLRAERICILTAKECIKNRTQYKEGAQYVALVKRLAAAL